MITGTRYRMTLEVNRQLVLAREIDRAQTEISTGKRIQGPSDDPVAAARVSDLARAQADGAAWTLNLQTAAATSSRADNALKAVATALDRAKELMLAGSNGTLSDGNRATLALELRSIAEEIASLQAEKDARGEPLFAETALEIPVGPGLTVRAVGTRPEVFGSVDTAGGLKDIVSIVQAAADALENTDPAIRGPAVQTSVAEVDAASTHIAAARGEQGARGNRIDNLVERLAATGLVYEEERSGLESSNIMEVVARLQSRQLNLQAAQAAFARTNQSTLFDLLR